MFSRTLVIVAFAFFSVVAAAPEDCASKFKQDDNKHSYVTETCVKELKINSDEMPKTEEEFTKTYDDKCFARCFMKAMKLFSDTGFNRDAIKADIADYVIDEKLRKDIEAYTFKCIDETEATLNGGKITKDNECKLASQFMYCTMKKEGELKC